MQTLQATLTLPALIESGLSGDRDAALVERRDGLWVRSSSAEVLDRVRNIACGLRELGLHAGDRVALISPNCVDWLVSDFAILSAGLVVVPIFPTQALDQVQFILENSESKVIFVNDEAAANRLRTMPMTLPPIITFEGASETSLAALEARGARARAAHPDLHAEYSAPIAADDLAVLIYTSGTTGVPKGVMLTHKNIASNVESSFGYSFGHIEADDAVLSVLPFSHIYEHMIAYGYIRTKVHLYICHDANQLLADLQEVRPIAMTSVPRIFERVIAGITGKAMAAGGMQARLVPWALAIGREYMKARAFGKSPALLVALQYPIAHALVLKKIKPALGLDRLRFFCSGSAPLHIDTAMTMLGFGVTILEGYGPTECSPVITVNRLQDNRYGTVGRPIPGVEIKLADNGEILVHGPNVMKGYYKDEASTAAVLQGGWYHTGDVGVLDENGYLKITDRIKELYKTSGGKFVAPSRVESAIKRSVFISQVLVVGESRPHPAALVSPNWDLVRTELSIDPKIPIDALYKRPDVVDFLTQEVRTNTADLATFEQVRRIVVLPRELTVESGELSPTLKVKRRVVEQKYAAEIDRAYAQDLHAAHA